MAEIKLREESYRVIGACFEVYNRMGAGFLEAVYHECLGIEFSRRGIPFVSRKPLKLYYGDEELLSGYAPDFVVFDKVVLEIKACEALHDKLRAQALNYVKASRLELGLLVNFGAYPHLQYERFVCTDDRYSPIIRGPEVAALP